jgi:two-component system chemotaxis response regulator CheB
LDLLAKPSWHELGSASTALTLERLRELSEVPVIRRWHQTKTPVRPRSIPPSARVRSLAICASTGGPAVLSQMLSKIAPGLEGVSVLIVQHVLAGFSTALADWLTETTGVRVELATHGATAEPGMVLLAPDGHHLLVDAEHRLQVVDEAPVGAHRPSGNLLFESAAQTYGAHLLAVILTGMGRDGVDGLRLARSRGATVLAQAPETCAVPGMPAAAIDAGVVDLVLTPEQLADEIAERLGFRPRGEG